MSGLPHLQSLDEALAWLRQRVAPSATLCHDSRRLQEGDVFVAWPGQAQDGRKHVLAALQAGAKAVLIESQNAPADLPDAADRVATFSGLKHAAGKLAANWYGQPTESLALVAITGTNGKTTVAWWLAHAIAHGGKSCGYIGTLGAGLYPTLSTSTGLTSPEATDVQKLLRDMGQAGAAACTLEASSIGLEQGRLNAAHIRVAVLTNLSQDHLDYHGNMQAYAKAKESLFHWPGLQAAVINAQDALGADMLRQLKQAAQSQSANSAVELWDYAIQTLGEATPAARLLAGDIRFEAGRTYGLLQEFGCAHQQPLAEHRFDAPIVGLYNVQNLLAVVGALRALGYPLLDALAACRALPTVPGRMHMLGGERQPLIVVDYAHTPEALRAALSALRPVAQQRGGRLSVVFGCGGDRDTSKRPLMAMAAAQCSDALWLTSDNPRSEDPASILAQVQTGLTGVQRSQAQVLSDRREAIAAAIAAAQREDVVLVAGKGHEDYQEVRGAKLPFSDAEEAAKALRSWYQSGAAPCEVPA